MAFFYLKVSSYSFLFQKNYKLYKQKDFILIEGSLFVNQIQHTYARYLQMKARNVEACLEEE